jgi:hypothetical protein
LADHRLRDHRGAHHRPEHQPAGDNLALSAELGRTGIGGACGIAGIPGPRDGSDLRHWREPPIHVDILTFEAHVFAYPLALALSAVAFVVIERGRHRGGRALPSGIAGQIHLQGVTIHGDRFQAGDLRPTALTP